MGDVAMTVPVLVALTNQYPQLKITLVTRYFFAPFFRDLKNVTVFAPDLGGKHKGALGLYKLSRELKALGFDVIADLHNVLRTKLVSFFLFGKRCVKIDKGRAEKKALVKGEYFKQLKSTHQRYADVFEKLGYPICLNEIKELKPIPLNNQLLDILDNTGERKLIGIAPFAFYDSKMYPLPLMEEVIEKLSQKYKVILFGGGTKEITILDELSKKFKGVTSVAGKLKLPEELDIISNLDVMLSMDSANGHLAAMLGVKVITVWGVTHPYAGFTPFNQPEHHQIVADRTAFPLIPTSIYGNKFPDTYKAAAGSISPEDIINKIENILG